LSLPPVRGPEDEQAWDKAMRDLREAEAMDLARTPSAAVHKSYYAMHHAARAVLLRLDGDKAATSRGGVIGRFGQIAKSAPKASDVLMAAGSDFNRVYDERIGSDYDTQRVIADDDASECLLKARNFILLCARQFGFRSG
jgi:uncharacterized protein (UPF0332 family)